MKDGHLRKKKFEKEKYSIAFRINYNAYNNLLMHSVVIYNPLTKLDLSC